MPDVRQRPDATQLTERLVGWMSASMLDWPGRLAATAFLGGCSFACPFCHNAALLAPPCEPAPWGEFEAYLESKRDWLDGVVITGGEPTDDPDIGRLLERLAELGVPVKLDTNGSRPDVLETLLAEKLVAGLAMDVKTLPERYDDLVGRPGAAALVARSVDLIIGSGVPHEFRTTAYPGALALDDFERIAAWLRDGDALVIQQFRPEVTLDSRAGAVLPYRPDALREAASCCEKYLPTTVRGA
ncbi:MAG: anaerobic ribonucleoside-triphosphate reductase activating protein [Coriobacteriia bacterium]